MKLSVGRFGLPTSCLGGVFPGAECVCRNNLPDFGAPPAGGMTQKLGKSPSLRPCGTGRTFFLSGVVGDPAHLVSFLFHSQFFSCAVGEPLEVFLLSGQSKVSATCIPLFFPALTRVPRASGGGSGRWECFFLWDDVGEREKALNARHRGCRSAPERDQQEQAFFCPSCPS